ncbi:MAG: CPBP family intramembrane metalloprotease [Planctomycetes bacterium]|nr:CPBP family intramembrane metalloprotease [Planctomycetota bacterium]
MFVEGAVCALFIGYGLGYVVYKVLFPLALAKPFFTNIWTGIIFSVGAGVYEEIVFRLLLITALYFIFANLFKIRKPISAIVSVLIGALIFATVHYTGTLKDSFTYASFTFRLLSGLVLSVIFMFRGLGVVVYTHAIYDVLTVLKPFHV